MLAPRTLVTVSLLFAIAVFVAACGSDPTATPTPRPSGGATPTATPTPAARDMEAYFSDKTIVLYVGFSPGGGYDTFARLFGSFAGKHLPGDPKFVVKNVPGSGGERVFRGIYSEDADGTHISVTHPRFFKRELLGEDVEFLDLEKTIFLGSPSAASEATAIYTFKDFATTWEEATAKGLTTGATAIGDTGGIAGAFVQALGGPVEVIYGYGGSAEIGAAFDRGEITGSSRGNYTFAPTQYPEWVEGQLIVPIVRYGADPETDPAFVKYVTEDLGAEIPPHLSEVFEATADQWAVYDLTETVNDVASRSFMLKEGTPEDIVEVWLEAFKATVEDPEFVEAAAALGRAASYASGEEILAAFTAGKAALAKDPALEELFAQLAGVED